MVELAREHAAGAADLRVLALPDDPLPPADAVVSVGHVVSYLDDEKAVERALLAIAAAVRPGGLFVLDICDLEWGAARRDAPNHSRVEDDWVIVTRFSTPSPERFVRDITTFVRRDDGAWRRGDERHDNVLIDSAEIPALLAGSGVDVTVGAAFGSEILPVGLRVVVGRRA